MIKALDSAARNRIVLRFSLGLFLGLTGACGGSSAAVTAGQTPKAAAATLPACMPSDVCTELGTCLLTSQEHLDAFTCRACSDDAVKTCVDPKTCVVQNANTLEALVCRAIRKDMPCKDAVGLAIEAWRKDGEPPFLDESILRQTIRERYARQAKPALACPSEPAKTTTKP